MLFSEILCILNISIDAAAIAILLILAPNPRNNSADSILFSKIHLPLA